MISKDKDDKLIRIYFYTCDKFKELQFYCGRFRMYYYGLKLHLLGFRRIGKLPHPEQILFTPASVNDVTVFKDAWSDMENRTFWGDKIYFVNELNQHMPEHQNSEVLAPVKAVKGMPEVIKQRLKAADDLFSTSVSKIRQPVEAIFNWLIEKADIQKASKVRFTKGLMVHVFGRLAAAFITLAI